MNTKKNFLFFTSTSSNVHNETENAFLLRNGKLSRIRCERFH